MALACKHIKQPFNHVFFHQDAKDLCDFDVLTPKLAKIVLAKIVQIFRSFSPPFAKGVDSLLGLKFTYAYLNYFIIGVAI